MNDAPMNDAPMNRFAMLTLALAGLLTSSCAATFDLTYALGDKRYSESSTKGDATEHSVDRLEVELKRSSVAGSPQVTPLCYRRTRHVELQHQVKRTFEYRGGLKPDTYKYVAIADIVIAGMTTGILGAICSRDNNDISCLNMLWASPQMLSAVYGFIRMATSDEPVLVDKERYGGHFALASSPSREEVLSCQEVATFALGSAAGAPEGADRDDLATRDLVVLAPDSLPVAVEQGQLLLDQRHLEQWLGGSAQRLHAVDAIGQARATTPLQCADFKALAIAAPRELRDAYFKRCPLPSQSGAPDDL